MAQWKNDNMLIRYKETTPVGERNEIGKWQSKKDYDDSLTGSRANLDRRLRGYKHAKGSDFKELIDPDGHNFKSLYRAFTNNGSENSIDFTSDTILNSWSNILTHVYKNREELFDYITSNTPILSRYKFPHNYKKIANIHGGSYSIPEDSVNGWNLRLLDMCEPMSDRNETFIGVLLKNTIQNRVDFIKENGLPLDITLCKGYSNLRFEDEGIYDNLPKNVISDQDCLCLELGGYDGFKYFNNDEEPNVNEVLKLLSKYKFRKLADCIRKGYIELVSIDFVDLESDFQTVEFRFSTSTDILYASNGENGSVLNYIIEAFTEFNDNPTAVTLEDLGEDRNDYK